MSRGWMLPIPRDRSNRQGVYINRGVDRDRHGKGGSELSHKAELSGGQADIRQMSLVPWVYWS